MTEKRVSENELVLPALYFIDKEPGITTSRLRLLLIDLVKPTGKDAEIAKGRNDTYFEQKVRNLVSSHRRLQNLGYATYSGDMHTITESGKSFLQANIDVFEYLLSGDFNYDDIKSSIVDIMKEGGQKRKILKYDENLVIEEGTRRVKNVQVYERSKKLREAAISYYKINGHITCSVCSFDFYVVYGERGRGYSRYITKSPLFSMKIKILLSLLNKLFKM